MSKAALNRLKKIEAMLKPAGKAPSSAGPIALWREDTHTNLFRRETGGPWVDESEMMATLPTPAKKHCLRLVVVRGAWSQVEKP